MFQKNKITNNIEPTKPSKNLAAKLVLLSASTVSIAGLIGSSITYANTTTNNTQDNTSSKSAIIAKTNSTASAGAKLAPKLTPKLDSKLDSKSIKLINFDHYKEINGDLVVAEGCSDNVPFSIARVFNVRSDKWSIRGKHAHCECTQLMICTNGSVKVTCDDGKQTSVYILDKEAQS